MRARFFAVVAVSALVFSGTQMAVSADTLDTVERVCPSPAPEELKFSSPTYIDTNRAGGEPVSVVAQDGSINVSAHAGSTHLYKNATDPADPSDFLNNYTNQTLNWRSTDGGKTWAFIGLSGLESGPHTLTSSGFSDPDYAIDKGGRIYNTEIDLANVAVFSSNDDGQTYSRGLFEVTSGDRPWLTAGDKDEVFLYVNNPKQLWRSTDGGLSWRFIGQGNAVAVDSKMLNDPKNFATGLIGPSGNGIAISSDEGATWRRYPNANLGPSTDFFDVTAVDRAGNVYRAAAGGYGSATDVTANGTVTFNYMDRSSDNPDDWQWADEAVTIPTPDGDALWPWVIGGDDGRAAVVWYQNLAGSPNEFYIYAAYTTNATGSLVTCSDGTTEFFPPQFSVANASDRPIHRGQICLNGTNCNLSSGDGGDRRLGDFFTVNFDGEGNLFIVSGDSLLRNGSGKKKLVGNPIFIRQTKGASMLSAPDYNLSTPEPDPARPTRPSCTINPAC
jgi:photosystem II stability/assembly factor-like uncharacterized protein